LTRADGEESKRKCRRCEHFAAAMVQRKSRSVRGTAYGIAFLRDRNAF
jgi:hypothetical protein